MKIALGQINTTVGDLSGNVNLMVSAARRAADSCADLIAFPELSITGYPPRDLVEKESFLDRSECELQRLARETAELPIALICGYVGKAPEDAGKRIAWLTESAVERLSDPVELDLLKRLAIYPRMLEAAAAAHEHAFPDVNVRE